METNDKVKTVEDYMMERGATPEEAKLMWKIERAKNFEEDLQDLRNYVTTHEREVRETAFKLLEEYKDQLITIAIENTSMRGCVTSNQINKSYSDFWASTHKVLLPEAKQ